MNRLIAIGIGLVWGGTTLAADPVKARTPAAPAASLRMVSATDVTQPLPTAVTTSLPPPGTDYPLSLNPAPCAGEGCADGTCATGGLTCREKLINWLCFRPGPPVLPLCTPIPYQAPLRHYFPCHPGQCLVVGGCRPSAGCGAGGCGHAGQPGPLAPATASHGYAHQAATPPPGSTPAQPTARVTRPTLRERMKGAFASVWSDPTPGVTFPTQGETSGPTVVPAPTGLRYAAPGGQQPSANGAVTQAGHQQPSANRPLTKQ
jgi:hypothetical protein